MLKEIYDVMDEKQASNIVMIDFRLESSFYDYFIIASAKNHRMAISIIEAIEAKIKELGKDVRTIEGDKNSPWQLIDCYEVIVHIFLDDERELYNLENLWSDLPRVKF
ncbi:MAG: ribosome silencing factor [Anaerorhabdus sp.]